MNFDYKHVSTLQQEKRYSNNIKPKKNEEEQSENLIKQMRKLNKYNDEYLIEDDEPE